MNKDDNCNKLTNSSLVMAEPRNSLPPPGYQIHILCDVIYLLLIFRVYLLMFCDVIYSLLIPCVYLLMFCDVTFALIFCDVIYSLLIFCVYLLMFCDVTFALIFCDVIYLLLIFLCLFTGVFPFFAMYFPFYPSFFAFFAFFPLEFIFLPQRTTQKNISRKWFRSTDLWVMGPARFHCATLLL